MKFEVEYYKNYRGEDRIGVRFIGTKPRKMARRYDLILSAEEASRLREQIEAAMP